MLTIAIPVYQFDARPLVEALLQQARQLAIAWEILIFDDASPPPWSFVYAEWADHPDVRFERMPENLGRATIRNRLAAAARYDYMLFLDGDGGELPPNFLAAYADRLQPDRVLYGGRKYAPDPPADPACFLHWHYGHQREAIPTDQRRKQPYHAFMTNNFCVPRAIMLRFPFEDRLRQYGHEDTLFGLTLHRHGIPIEHFDNPVVHLGLEPAAEWLSKQRRAIQNLFWLQQQEPDLHTRALRLWQLLQRFGLWPLVHPWFARRAPEWEQRLALEIPPRLRLLDGLKLYWLGEESEVRGQ